MAIVFSYGWRRDPERLLEECGIGRQVERASEEVRFMDALDAMPDGELGDMCLVMGGFMDGLLGRAYKILDLLPPSLSGFDIYYREHDEIKEASRLVSRYGKASRRIVLIGHSWGGSSLARDVLTSGTCAEVPVDVLITLDPVGVRGPRFLPQVAHWLNVYLPYDRARWSRENNVARLGMPWEHVKQASLNRVPAVLRHSDAAGMFRSFGASYLDLAFMRRSFGASA